MDMQAVPSALRARLGTDVARGLVELLDRFKPEVSDHVIDVCTERFERRLAEQVAGVRVQTAQVESSLRQEMARMGAELRQEMGEMRFELRQEMGEMRSELRQEMAEMRSELRQEMGEMRSELRQEMAEMGAGLRQEIVAGRFELLKWCFIFWIGQAFTIAGIAGVMIRVYRP